MGQWWRFELCDNSATSKASKNMWWNFELLAESLVWYPKVRSLTDIDSKSSDNMCVAVLWMIMMIGNTWKRVQSKLTLQLTLLHCVSLLVNTTWKVFIRLHFCTTSAFWMLLPVFCCNTKLDKELSGLVPTQYQTVFFMFIGIILYVSERVSQQ